MLLLNDNSDKKEVESNNGEQEVIILDADGKEQKYIKVE